MRFDGECPASVTRATGCLTGSGRHPVALPAIVPSSSPSGFCLIPASKFSTWRGRRESWNSLDSTVPAVKLLTIASKCSSESWKPPYEGMRSVVARVALIRLMRPSLANPLATGMQKADPLFGIGL